MKGNERPPSQKQYAAIGKVACKWAYIEATLRNLFTALSKLEERSLLSATITAELNAQSLLNLVYAVCYDQSSPIYRHLKALEPRLNELRRKRNAVVHLDWYRGVKGDATALKATAKGQFDLLVHRMSTVAMEQLANDIEQFNATLCQRLTEFREGKLPEMTATRPRHRRGVVREVRD